MRSGIPSTDRARVPHTPGRSKRSRRDVEARADPRQRDEDEERTEAQDRDANREESRRVASIGHDPEQELEDGRDEERGASEEADLDGSESAEDGLEDGDLPREDRDGAVVRQMVDRIREEDAALPDHTPR